MTETGVFYFPPLWGVLIDVRLRLLHVYRSQLQFETSCSSFAKPETELLGSTSGACVRLSFGADRQMSFYGVTLLSPVGLCTLPLLALLVPRPLSRDCRLDWSLVRVPALLTIAGVFIFQLHFISTFLHTRLSLIGTSQLNYVSISFITPCRQHTVYIHKTLKTIKHKKRLKLRLKWLKMNFMLTTYPYRIFHHSFTILYCI